MNVHGAGAQRSAPKSGDPQAPQWASGLGPQGAEIRVYHYARAVPNSVPDAVTRVPPKLTPLPVPPAVVALVTARSESGLNGSTAKAVASGTIGVQNPRQATEHAPRTDPCALGY